MATDDDFRRAMARVEQFEGGWSNHKADPGGLTKWGVTLATIRALRLDFNRDGRLNAADLRDMTKEQAREVYRRNYWDKSGCPDLPAPLALLVFDSAVNQGPGRAVKFLQIASGLTGRTVDGRFGPFTRAAALRRFDRDPLALLAEYQARRVVHYGGLSIFRVFGLGWSRRALIGHQVAVGWQLGEGAQA